MEDVLKDDPIEGPPRKRLLTDRNPKRRLVTEFPESTVSFDSPSDRLAKKTRELPNLSDCHSCSVRINYTNPRERLQPLDSMWRIVLLCKKCTKRVNSSDLCPYCFSAVVDVHDCVKCRNCQRSIHNDCVARFGSGIRFSVCVDCWIPDAVAKSIRARKKKLRKKNECSSEQAANWYESRVSLVQTNEAKTVVSTNAIESCVETKIADDPPLACYSRRRSVAKTVLMNSISSDVPLVCYSKRRRESCLGDSASLNPPLISYSRRRSRSRSGSGSGSKASSTNSQENDGGRIDTEANRFMFTYCRIGKGIPRPLFSVNKSGCSSSMDSANLDTESMHNMSNFRNVNERDEISENRDVNSNRFLLTYKRYSRCKPEFSCKVEDSSPMLPSMGDPKTVSTTQR